MNTEPELSFAYPFQRSRLLNYWNKKFELKTDLAVEHVKNAFVLPMTPPKYGGGWMGDGGVLTSDKKFVESSQICGANRSKMMGAAYPFEEKNAPRLSGSWVYLGACLTHWGHFLVDSTTRMWLAMERPDLNYLFLLPAGQKKENLPAHIRRLLELAPFDNSKIHFVSEPVSVEEVISPEPAYIREVYYSPKYLETFAGFAKNIQPSANNAPKKVFFSRSLINHALNKEVGSEILDRLFEKLGYSIIFPETESVDDQIFYIINCEEFAALSGSIIHGLPFRYGRLPLKRIYIINRSPYVNITAMESCRMLGVAPSILDFYISQYFVNHTIGPFFLFRNNLMREFMQSEGIDFLSDKLMDDAEALDFFRRYEILYHKVWPNPSLYRNVSNANPSSDAYYNPSFFQEWSDTWSRLQWLAAREGGKIRPNPDDAFIFRASATRKGWGAIAKNNGIVGDPGAASKIEILSIFPRFIGLSVNYQPYSEASGWGTIAKNGESCGAAGTPLQGVRIFKDAPCGLKLFYRIFREVWSPWLEEGIAAIAPEGFSAIQIKAEIDPGA